MEICWNVGGVRVFESWDQAGVLGLLVGPFMGEVWGWGMSMYGQLGLGFSGDSFEPGLGMTMSKVQEPTEISQFLP